MNFQYIAAEAYDSVIFVTITGEQMSRYSNHCWHHSETTFPFPVPG